MRQSDKTFDSSQLEYDAWIDLFRSKSGRYYSEGIKPSAFTVGSGLQGSDTFSFDEIRCWLQDIGFERVHTVEAPGLAPLLILATKPKH
jgi:hypothetical protein